MVGEIVAAEICGIIVEALLWSGRDLLYGLVIVRLDRRDIIWINVTANPTAEWVCTSDNGGVFLGMRLRTTSFVIGIGSMAAIVTRRLRAMGIRDKPTAPASPWQNGFAERLIGSIRRECVDHFIVLGEAHLRRILRAYAAITTTSERIDH